MENFEQSMTAGNVKAAMKEVGAVSADLWHPGGIAGESQKMSDQERQPDAWIIESKAGIWLTLKADVAEKNRTKPGTIVTPYFSKKPPDPEQK